MSITVNPAEACQGLSCARDWYLDWYARSAVDEHEPPSAAAHAKCGRQLLAAKPRERQCRLAARSIDGSVLGKQLG